LALALEFADAEDRGGPDFPPSLAIDANGCAFQDDVDEGDHRNFPAGIPHSIQGLEGDGCEFLLVFDDGNFYWR